MDKVWKYDKNGNERPLQEQLDRRKADLIIIDDHISWYSRNPIHRTQLQQTIAHQKRLDHKQGILDDIKRLENKIKR